MGEISEMMLDGTLCQGCGVALSDADSSDGVPAFCFHCDPSTDWSAHRDEMKLKKADRLRRFDHTGWQALTEYHFRMMVGNVRFDYWPSTAKVEWRGKIYHGVDPEDIQSFIDNRTDR
jgi:hypothetical protein